MTQDFEAILRNTFADGRLSRGERQALAQVLDDCMPVQLAVVRNRAFAIAQEQVDPERARQALEWCEDVVQLIASRESARAERERGASHQALFSPGDSCLRKICELIRGARGSIDVCVFTITDNRITDALIEAHRLKRDVRVITDNDKSEDKGSDIEQIARAGIDVRMDRTDKHMHHKFAIFDESLVLTGSYNWTRSAANHNEENLVVSNDNGLIASFRREFDGLWTKFG